MRENRYFVCRIVQKHFLLGHFVANVQSHSEESALDYYAHKIIRAQLEKQSKSLKAAFMTLQCNDVTQSYQFQMGKAPQRIENP